MLLSVDDMLPLHEAQVQPYFSNRIQLAEVIEWVLRQTGPATVLISTFSTSEEFLRRLARMKSRGKVTSCELFCDLRAAKKTLGLYYFIREVFTAVHLCENHSKVVLIFNEDHHVAIVTSQNQTRGDRFEAGIVTSDYRTFVNLRLGFDVMAEKSISLDRLALQ